MVWEYTKNEMQQKDYHQKNFVLDIDMSRPFGQWIQVLHYLKWLRHHELVMRSTPRLHFP